MFLQLTSNKFFKLQYDWFLTATLQYVSWAHRQLKVSRLFFRHDTVLRPWVLKCLPSLKKSNLKKLLQRLPIHLIVLAISSRLVIKDKKVSCSLRLLVLDHSRFRDDLEALNQFSKIELLIMPNWVQRWITAISEESRSEKSTQEEYLPQFLQSVLHALCRHREVDGILSCGFYYAQNEIWEKACARGSIPFCCIHRELVGAEPNAMKAIWGNEVKHWRKFQGHLLMVASNAARDMLLDESYIHPSKLVVTGVPRFDIAVNNSKKRVQTSLVDPPQEAKKTIVLFSFPVATAQPILRKSKGTFPNTGGFQLLFSSVHQLLAQFAHSHPNVKVIIRPKWYDEAWKSRLDQELDLVYKNTGSWPRNLDIVDNIGAQELIGNAGAVISLNSTTGVEALMHSVPSILPHYHEAAADLRNHLLISHDTTPFYVAHSEHDLQSYLELYAEGALPSKLLPPGFLDNIIGPTDGQCASRIESKIIELKHELQ